MKTSIMKAALAAGICLSIAGPASAAITISSQAATGPYTGPAPTLNFDATDLAGLYSLDGVVSGSDGTRAQPLGSTGTYFSVGPTEGTPRVISLASFATIGSISFLWGSIDTYNILEVLGTGGSVLATYTGASVPGAGNFGDRTSSLSNRLVKLDLSGASESAVTGLRLGSSSNAFEIDSISVGVVPEPETWMMLIGGFLLVGGMLRQARRRTGAHTALA